MKEAGKIQLDILFTKKDNITKNISNINQKIEDLNKQLQREQTALGRVNNTISNFGKKKVDNVDSQTKDIPSQE